MVLEAAINGDAYALVTSYIIGYFNRRDDSYRTGPLAFDFPKGAVFNS